MKNLCFLDVDGVLNSELTYAKQKDIDKTKWTREQYTDFHFDKERIQWLNEWCKNTDTAVVISSTWRSDPDIEETFRRNGATFEIVGKTPYQECRHRGCEINKWLQDNCKEMFGVHYFQFKRYVIFDDDSDMLLNQAMSFFHCDRYYGLTPNILYKAGNFLNSLK